MKVEECIVSNELRPTAKAEGLWASIITDQEVKDRLFRTALLGLRLRPELPFTTTVLHGLALLYGPPGTGRPPWPVDSPTSSGLSCPEERCAWSR